MKIRIQKREGPKDDISTTLIVVTSAYPSAITALTALVPLPAGWRVASLKPTYALYIGPADDKTFCQGIIATPPPTFTFPVP